MPIRHLIKLFQHFVESNTQDGKHSETEAVKPYEFHLPLNTKDVENEQAKENDLSQKKGMHDDSEDYWIDGVRFGKRSFDYGLTKTRFGRSVDHVDISEKE